MLDTFSHATARSYRGAFLPRLRPPRAVRSATAAIARTCAPSCGAGAKPMGRNQTGPRRGGYIGSAGHTTARRAAITLRRKHEDAMNFPKQPAGHIGPTKRKPPRPVHRPTRRPLVVSRCWGRLVRPHVVGAGAPLAPSNKRGDLACHTGGHLPPGWKGPFLSTLQWPREPAFIL